MSVILTNGVQDAMAAPTNPPTEGIAGAFADAFTVAVILVAGCLVPAFFLPRRKVAPVDPAALVHSTAAA